jgi:hypothetical protein
MKRPNSPHIPHFQLFLNKADIEVTYNNILVIQRNIEDNQLVLMDNSIGWIITNRTPDMIVYAPIMQSMISILSRS